MRRLLGVALQPTSVSKLIPSIQETAESLVDQAILQQSTKNGTSTITMYELCLKYTLEIACRHIIGLQDLSDEEVDYFLSQVKIWIGAMYLGPGDNSWVAARDYLLSKIKKKAGIPATTRAKQFNSEWNVVCHGSGRSQ